MPLFRRSGRRSRLPGLFLSLALSGCATVGPNYVRPELPVPARWHAGAGRADGAALARWWTALGDPVLESLIARAVSGNLDLKETRARVREARARRGAEASKGFPTVTAGGSASRSRSSANAGVGGVHDAYSAGFDASWEVDLFGGVRRGVEAADADLAAAQEDLNDVLVSLASEVALNYVEVRSEQARLATAASNLQAQSETVRLVEARRKAGVSDALALEQARQNLESTRALLPGLRTALEGAQNRLAVLLGEAPGALHRELEDPKAVPAPPVSVAVGVPADALRRRPDVRRAERQLAAQTARVGVATAELYPKLTLGGSIGLESLSAGDLISPASRVWSLLPRITLPVFNAGAIRRNIEAHSALQEQALARYEASVLKALEEVENALVAYAQELDRHEALRQAAQAAGQTAQLADQKYRAGAADFLAVLDAQRSVLNLQDQLVQSQAAVTADVIRLYKAVGGGWTPLVAAPTEREAS